MVSSIKATWFDSGAQQRLQEREQALKDFYRPEEEEEEEEEQQEEKKEEE